MQAKLDEYEKNFESPSESSRAVKVSVIFVIYIRNQIFLSKIVPIMHSFSFFDKVTRKKLTFNRR